MRISTGRSRKDQSWKVVEVEWFDLVQKLKKTVRTTETYAEYKAMKKDEQGAVKDIGGFVGGVVEGGRRKRESVQIRTLVTLDADYAKKDMWDTVSILYDYTMACYSTHSHHPDKPRLRFVIPLDREVTAEEYEPIARMVAKDFGIEQFDTTTYEASRLMYWPSTSQDGAYYFRDQDGPILSADETLARYEDWRDSAQWPTAAAEHTIRAKEAKRQGDPTEKPGIIGVFCRAYDIHEAISAFLPVVYTATDVPSRYTFAGGSAYAGVITYDNKFSYSHHSTDPAGGQLCNSFDLVRLHIFGDMDYKAEPGTPINKLPSFNAMTKLARDDDNVKKLVYEETKAAAAEDFAEKADDDDSWMTRLAMKQNGQGYENTIGNIELILRNDPDFAGKIRYDRFDNSAIIVGKLPWSKDIPGASLWWGDSDDSQMLRRLEDYKIFNAGKTMEHALRNVSMENGFHPVQEYLESLTWDGVKRVDTMFIDYMGADDNQYTRTVTRKWLVAAVRRVMQPGTKFDNMIVLVGAQGVGKSTMAMRLGKKWFSDTEIRIGNGKDSLESLRGKWIVEMAELSGMKRSDIEAVKQYLASSEDIYRPAFDHHFKKFPRQCVFYGSTNDTEFLKDRTGNRRFWPIQVDPHSVGRDKIFREFTPEVVDQIWAEAMVLHKAGEELYLDHETTELAISVQEQFVEDNQWLGVVGDHLERMLPSNWPELTAEQRRDYIQGYPLQVPLGELTYRRDEFSLPEIEYELFGVDAGKMKVFESREAHSALKSLKGWKRSTSRRKTDYYGVQYIYQRVVR